MKRFALLAVACLSLAACNTPSTPNNTTTASSTLIQPQAMVVDAAKAEVGAETAYNVAANAYVAAVKSGWTGASKDKAKAILQTAYSKLLDLRAAQSQLSSTDLLADANAIISLVNTIPK